MPKARIVETDSGIQGEFNVTIYDTMQRRLRDRGWYVRSNGDKMPFDNTMFDAVLTNGSLHEWADPKNTMNEIWRVLKKGGRVFISDLRRDMFFLMRWFLYIASKPKEIRPGLISSINAAYTLDELKELIKDTKLTNYAVTENMIGLMVTGKK